METATSEGCRTKHLVALNLLLGRKRMQIRQFRPSHGDHFGGGVQLHRAGAQGNHAMNQRQILRLQPVKVSEQLMLRVVLVEDWVRKIWRGPLQAGGKTTLHSSGDLLGSKVHLSMNRYHILMSETCIMGTRQDQETRSEERIIVLYEIV